MKRREGTTIEQITAPPAGSTTPFAAPSLAQKLGFSVEATCTLDLDPNKTSAKGSSTAYRITG